MQKKPGVFEFFKRRQLAILLAILFAGALGIRMLDLTDLPNDFYMVRQYGSILIARGMYYANLESAPDWQRDMAVAQWQQRGLIEPPIMERLAALTYTLTGEHYWVGRVYASLFWLAGGIAIWLLAKDLSARAGGLVAVAYFLFLPFGMLASRAFMPDPLMTALVAWSFWALHSWEVHRTWRSALLAGILTGLAILVKSVAVFPLLGAAAGLVLSRGSWKRILADRQTWAVAGVTVIPSLIFYFYGLVINGTLGGQFGFRFFPSLLKDASFYVRWLFTAAGVSGVTALLVSLAGILLTRSKPARSMLIGAWVGYVAFGFSFPYHFITHEYYHLPLIPIVAIGILPVADLVFRQIADQKGWYWRGLAAGILLLGVGMTLWEQRNALVRVDYREEIAYWQDLGDLIGHDTSIIELSGDYGYRLAYFGWVDGSHWLTTADDALRTLAGQPEPEFNKAFAEQTAGKDLFVVTDPNEWNNQAELQDYLTTHYPLIASDPGDGYWIFDLKNPLP